VVSYGAITASGPLWKMLLGVPVPFVINMAGHLGRYETGRTARRHGRVLLWGRWIRTIRRDNRPLSSAIISAKKRGRTNQQVVLGRALPG
jgi:hypothetical protein